MARNYAALLHEYLEEMQELNDAEFGRLARALLTYSMTGEPIALSGNERFYAKRVMSQEDRFQGSYNEATDRKREAGKKGAANRWNSKNGNAILPLANDSKNGYTETKTNTETNIPLSIDSRNNAGAVVSVYLDRVNPSASQTSLQKLCAYAETMGPDVCLRAIDIALDNKAAKWNYIEAILSKWQSMGVKCLADIDRLDKKPERTSGESKRGGKSIPGWGDTDRSVDKAMLRDMAELDMILKGEEGG